MAQRHWVGGTNTWNATAGTKWSLTNGGAGGQAAPTASDDVFFDSGSGAGTVTIGGGGVTVNCLTLDTTGFTGTLDMGSSTSNVINLNGNITTGSGTTWTGTTGAINMNASSTITSNGKSIPAISGLAAGGTYTLADDLTLLSGARLTLSQGTFNANNKNVTINDIRVLLNTTTLTMGSGTWTLTGNDTHCFDATTGCWNTVNLTTFNANTSTLKFTNTLADDGVTFTSNGYTYNNVWFANGSSAFAVQVKGGPTINDLKYTGTVANTMSFQAGTTTTVTTFTVSGTAGSLISIVSTSTAVYTLSCASGIISCDYLLIAHSVATGGATFYAGTHSTNNQAVATAGSGWIFTGVPVPGTGGTITLLGV